MGQKVNFCRQMVDDKIEYINVVRKDWHEILAQNFCVMYNETKVIIN